MDTGSRADLRNSTPQGRDVFQLAGNLLREDKRIGAPEEALEGGHLRGIGLRADPDSLQGGLRPIVPAQESGAAAFLAHQLHRGLKEIREEPQLGIERVECLLRLRRSYRSQPTSLRT